jgi:oxaloacetate decarboxylase alpha subunit
LREKYPKASDDERLLRYMFAGNQVDAMLAAGPMQTQLNFGIPIVDLLKELVKTRKAGRVYVSKGGLQIELKRVADRATAR